MRGIARTTTVWLAVVCCFAASPLRADTLAESDRTPGGVISFTAVATPRATFRIDPALAARVQPLLDRITERLLDHDRQILETEAAIGRRDVYLADINRLFGIAPDAELQQFQESVFDASMGFTRLRFAGPGELTFTIAEQARAKDHLRSGGHLPMVDYDPATDQARMHHDAKPNQIIDDVMVLITTGQPLEEAADIWFALDDIGLGTALHEVAEGTLLEPWASRRIDPHWRWFSDGLAEAITVHLLEQHEQAEALAQVRASYDPERFAEWVPELNLRYWLEAKFMPPTGAIEAERQRSLARYTFALAEIEKLFQDHGTDWVAKVYDDLKHHPTPGSAAILDALRQHTGVDMDLRLDRYQSFKTRDDGIGDYATRYGQAMQSGDIEAALVAAIRLAELQFIDREQGVPARAYTIIANRMVDLGLADQAHEMHQRVMDLDRDRVGD